MRYLHEKMYTNDKIVIAEYALYSLAVIIKVTPTNHFSFNCTMEDMLVYYITAQKSLENKIYDATAGMSQYGCHQVIFV